MNKQEKEFYEKLEKNKHPYKNPQNEILREIDDTILGFIIFFGGAFLLSAICMLIDYLL